MTAVGTLDGGAISYVTREAKETAFIDEVHQKKVSFPFKRLQKRAFSQTMPDMKGRFPVHIVAQSNHAQVASGKIT